jgi:hypothetical protein
MQLEVIFDPRRADHGKTIGDIRNLHEC